MDRLAAEFAYSFLCTGCFEFCWAKCATALGAIASTIGFTAFMLPACIMMDFVVWPEPGQELSQSYLGGMLLVTISFLVVSLSDRKSVV